MCKYTHAAHKCMNKIKWQLIAQFYVTWKMPHSLHAAWSFWSSVSWDSESSSLVISINGTRRVLSEATVLMMLSMSSLMYLDGTPSSCRLASSCTLGTGIEDWRFFGSRPIFFPKSILREWATRFVFLLDPIRADLTWRWPRKKYINQSIN